MLICPVSHICDGQKKSVLHTLQTWFFVYEMIGQNTPTVQNFRKIGQFLNRAVINRLIIALDNDFIIGTHVLLNMFIAFILDVIWFLLPFASPPSSEFYKWKLLQHVEQGVKEREITCGQGERDNMWTRRERDSMWTRKERYITCGQGERYVTCGQGETERERER